MNGTRLLQMAITLEIFNCVARTSNKKTRRKIRKNLPAYSLNFEDNVAVKNYRSGSSSVRRNKVLSFFLRQLWKFYVIWTKFANFVESTFSKKVQYLFREEVKQIRVQALIEFFLDFDWFQYDKSSKLFERKPKSKI